MKYTISGAGSISMSYLVTKGQPIDLRSAQSLISDLKDKTKFGNPQSSNDYRYEGMVVSVTDDPEDRNNGLYVLVDGTKRNSFAGWLKLNSSSATISQWNNENRELLKDEIALGYNNGNLEEVRVGNGTDTWSNTDTFIPAFLNSQKGEDGNKLFGLDSNSKPTIFAISSVATTLEKRNDSPGLSLSHDTNTNTYTIGINNDGWEITCN